MAIKEQHIRAVAASGKPVGIPLTNQQTFGSDDFHIKEPKSNFINYKNKILVVMSSHCLLLLEKIVR
jgi:hypothetical protein